MNALAAILGVVLFAWGVKNLWAALLNTSVQTQLREDRDDLDRLRERFASSDMTVEEFEDRLDALNAAARRPHICHNCSPERVRAQRMEIHVHNAPSGHHLHLHLP